MGAEVEPCSLCSPKTTPAISGLSRGAKNTNQPWSRRSRSVRPAACLPPCSEITCAVPVLPDTSLPGMRARPPVPAPLTTRNKPSCSALIVSGFSCTRDFGAGGGTGFQPLPSSTAFSSCGTKRVPPFATVDIITASEMGVIDTCPCPIETEIVSPAYHFSL